KRQDLASSTPHERREARAILRVKQFLAAKVGVRLPNVSFGRWIERVLGSPLTWEMNDCGEDGRLVCVEIVSGSPEATISLAIGGDEGGLAAAPTLFFGTIQLYDVDRRIRRFAELPAFVAEAQWRAIAFRDHPLRAVTDADAVRVGRSVPAQSLDPLLPREPFEQWFAGLLPPGVASTWRQEPCDGRNTQPSCVWVTAKWPNGSSATVSLDLESVQRGLTEQPSFSTAFIYNRARGMESYRSLVGFAAGVKAIAFCPSCAVRA